MIVRRSIGSPILFTIVYSSLASAIYFSLGVIAGHALGLTPLVFLIAAVMFALTAMTYVEGASLHQDRGGSTVFARYAFNELVELRRRLGDPARLRDPDRGHGVLGDAVPARLLGAARAQRRGARRWRWRSSRSSCSATSAASARAARGASASCVVGDIALQAFIVIVLGLVLFFDPHTLLDPIHLGSAPTWSDLIFALTVAVVAFTSLESASGLVGRGADQPRGPASGWSASATATVVVPLRRHRARRRHGAAGARRPHRARRRATSNAPMIGVVAHVHPHWLAQTLAYLVAGARRR